MAANYPSTRPASGPIIDPQMMVADLWMENKREWDMNVFEGVLMPEDQQLARQLYLSKQADQDVYEWAYTKNAKYTVRSGYWLATHNLLDEDVILPPNGSVVLKRAIWKLTISLKIKHFLWRCLSGALATNTRLRTRQIQVDPTCQRCCGGDETINHLLFLCPFAQAIWTFVQSTVGTQLFFTDNVEVNIEMFINMQKNKSLSLRHRLLPFWITWRIWKSRNDLMFQKINRSPDCEVQKGIQDANEWIEANNVCMQDEVLTHHVLMVTNARQRTNNGQWSPPPEGWIKCNFDSGYRHEGSYTNTGWIIRDFQGRFLSAGCAKLQQAISPLQSEAFGFLHVLQQVWISGLRHVWFESDNLELVNLINNCGDHIQLGTLLYDIRYWMSKLPYSSLGHVNREKNAAADIIARKGFTNDSCFVGFSYPPHWLIEYLCYPFTV